MDKKNNISNQKGAISLLGATLLLITFTLSILTVHFALLKLKAYREKTRFYLCIKEYNGLMFQYVDRIEQANDIIQLANTVDTISYIPSPASPALKMASKQVKKILKIKQNVDTVSHMKKLYDLLKKKCPLTPFHFRSPYTNGGIGTIRRNFNETAKGDTKWTQLFFSRNQIIKEEFTRTRKLKIKSKQLY